MLVCIPTEEFRGFDAPIYNHLGSAKNFYLYNTETKAISNHELGGSNHGSCQNVLSLKNLAVEVLLVGGVGKKALSRLADAKIRTLKPVEGSIAKNLKLLETGALEEFQVNEACGGHHHGGHGHEHHCQH
jgi:predicted Fe-Mo cluster-binding NifX family protein